MTNASTVCVMSIWFFYPPENYSHGTGQITRTVNVFLGKGVQIYSLPSVSTRKKAIQNPFFQIIFISQGCSPHPSKKKVAHNLERSYKGDDDKYPYNYHHSTPSQCFSKLSYKAHHHLFKCDPIPWRLDFQGPSRWSGSYAFFPESLGFFGFLSEWVHRIVGRDWRVGDFCFVFLYFF